MRSVLKMGTATKMHMKEWLIAQIDSGRYRGLCWEDDDKTMFRIPWKHAAKKDYRQTADAALFKAWAVYKGKHREGRDKADPTMWKTRLRCALNKSTDFLEVPERNQLDISEPYKVYLINYESATPAEATPAKDEVIIQTNKSPRSPGVMDKQVEPFQVIKQEKEKPLSENLMREKMCFEFNRLKAKHLSSAPVDIISPSLPISDFRLQLVFLYLGWRVMEVTTSSAEGCFIMQGSVPLGNERIYGRCSAQQVSFPSPRSLSLSPGLVEPLSRLLCHLERGVLLWAAPDGVFIKRFCQGRVYWSGPTAQHTDRPNKLEREKTFKLFDVPKFLNELRSCVQGKGSVPSYEIELCFGEEYPDPKIPKNRKLIMVQVVPMFAVELLQKFNVGEI